MLTAYERENMIQGKKINLIPATMKDRRNAYDWCFQSETTKSHSGPPDYPDKPVPTYEEFCETYYEEYYFTGEKPLDGRGFLIVAGGETVGFVSYCAFHLKPSIAELDIWINSEAHCGKGYGTDALISLGDYIHKELGFRELIIAPSAKNLRAVKSYEKSGFEKTDKKMSEFLLEEYVSDYGEGDYGTDETCILIKTY